MPGTAQVRVLRRAVDVAAPREGRTVGALQGANRSRRTGHRRGGAHRRGTEGAGPTNWKRVAAGESLDALLPEAFAVAREAASRVLSQRPFDEQVMGGVALHFGNIAEMMTGRVRPGGGAARLLECFGGKGVHIVTVNDYLAKRRQWMGQVHRSVGGRGGPQKPDNRRAAYAADITYGTNNEFGFDYLRDNMVHSLGEAVQRGTQLRHRRRRVDSILVGRPVPH